MNKLVIGGIVVVGSLVVTHVVVKCILAAKVIKKFETELREYLREYEDKDFGAKKNARVIFHFIKQKRKWV
jgi:hypothetical protein